jgi:nucleotide-binding universal stress UspA family protein
MIGRSQDCRKPIGLDPGQGAATANLENHADNLTHQRGRESGMYKNILIATDGSEIATGAVVQGLTLAKALNATATIVTVTEMWSALEVAHRGRAGQTDPVSAYEAVAAASAKTILDEADKVARSHGMVCKTLHVADMHPAEGIVETAQKIGADLIVVASHGRRGLSRLLLGSQTYEVVTHTKVPVLVIR